MSGGKAVFQARSIIFQIMEVKEERELESLQEEHQIIFEMVKKVPYGRAIFLSGGLEELGGWDPMRSLRLSWEEGDKWQVRVSLTSSVIQRISGFEFKFLQTEWERTPLSSIQWQIGNLNRRINIESIFQGSNIYYAEWNMQNYIFFLKTQDYEEQQTYYMEGSLEVLGCWRQKRLMKRLGSERANPFLNYWKNNPEFAEESCFSRIFMISFSVKRDVESFNYFYVCLGSNIQSETYPGRSYRLAGDETPKDRIIEFDWQGSKVIIDESTLDQMILQRFTNQIYLATHIQSYQQLYQVQKKSVTLLFTLIGDNEDYKASNFNIKPIANSFGLLTETRTIVEPDNSDFIDQLKEVVTSIEQLVVKGHRVCLDISRKVMRFFPMRMLHLILFLGYSFGGALEMLSKNQKPPELYCKSAREVYNFISEKLMRGRMEAKA